MTAADGLTGAREVLGYTDSAGTGGAENALMMLLAAPSALLLFRLDRVADRPERLRGATAAAPPLEAALAAEP